jgi:hypothetical protein
MSPSLRRALGILIVLALVAGALFLVVVRVPGDAVLVSGGRVHTGGWRWAPVWRPRLLVPLAGSLVLADASAPVEDELSLSWDIRLRLEIDPEALTLDAGALGSAGGLASYLGTAAAVSAAQVVEQGGGDPLLDSSLAQQREAVARALALPGMRVSDLQVELAENDDLRRLRRRRARALVRPTARKVMVIGLDGADWQVMDPLLEAGKLPHLAGLLRRGARADLRSNTPMLSPLLWTTVATGKPPEEHGIMDFLLIEPETGRKVPMSSRFRKVKALWNILTDLGLESQFIAWWATWPAEQVSGVMITDRVSYSLFAGLDLRPGDSTAGLTFPPGYMAEAESRLVAPEEITYQDVERFLRIDSEELRRGVELLEAPPESTPEHPVVAVARTLAAARSYHALALDLLARGQSDLFAVYYEGIDQMGHRFQHYMPPRMELVSEEEHRRYREAVAAYYAYQDELLGEIIEAAERDTVFLILSDHGFRNGAGRPRDLAPYVSEKPGLWHRRYGIFALAGPGIRHGRLDTVSLYDIAPTVLHLLGLPRAEDMPGRILTEALDTEPGPRIATYEGFGHRHRLSGWCGRGGRRRPNRCRDPGCLCSGRCRGRAGDLRCRGHRQLPPESGVHPGRTGKVRGGRARGACCSGHGAHPRCIPDVVAGTGEDRRPSRRHRGGTPRPGGEPLRFGPGAAGRPAAGVRPPGGSAPGGCCGVRRCGLAEDGAGLAGREGRSRGLLWVRRWSGSTAWFRRKPSSLWCGAGWQRTTSWRRSITCWGSSARAAVTWTVPWQSTAGRWRWTRIASTTWRTWAPRR